MDLCTWPVVGLYVKKNKEKNGENRGLANFCVHARIAMYFS